MPSKLTDIEELRRQSDFLNEVEDFGPAALEVNRSLTGLEPKNARYWNRLGRCFKEIDDLTNAQAAYAQAMVVRPESTVARNEFREVGRRIEARHRVEIILEREGPEGLRSEIRALREDYTETRFRLEGRIRLFEDSGDVWDLVGLARERSYSGEQDAAIRLYEQAREMGGSGVSEAVDTGMAAVLRAVRKPRQAERLARKVLESDPNSSVAWRALAGALSDQGRSAEAREAYQASFKA
jgi:Flp pilus assembly protein TadD